MAVSLKDVQVEDGLSVSVDSFIADFSKMIDEVKAESDITKMWHVKPEVAGWVFSTLNVLETTTSSDESEDFLDDEDSDEEDADEESGLLPPIYDE